MRTFSFKDTDGVAEILSQAMRDGIPPMFVFDRTVCLQTTDGEVGEQGIVYADGFSPREALAEPLWGDGFASELTLPTDVLHGCILLLRRQSPKGYQKAVFIDVQEGDDEPLLLRISEILKDGGTNV